MPAPRRPCAAGFLAAAEARGRDVRIRVFPHGEDGVLSAFEAAQRAGARVIVGPLVRDDLKIVAAMAIDLPYTIALNQLDEVAGPPPTLYTFSLSIDSDARLIARRMRETAPPTPSDGVPNVVVISSETPLMRRFAARVHERMAGRRRQRSGRDPLRRRRRRDDLRCGASSQRRPPAAALLAMDGASATLAKPYVGIVPAYASALVFERETMRDRARPRRPHRDRDPVDRHAERAAVRVAAATRLSSAALTRLYALGLDAFRVASAFREGAPERFALDGATGQVTLEGRQLRARGPLRRVPRRHPQLRSMARAE